MQRKFITYCIVFFIPVLIGYYCIEILTRNLPSRFKTNQSLIKNNKDSFETLILGSSQMKDAINPEWLDSPTINLSSSSQHHDSDYRIMKALIPNFKNLKTVVLEVSYSHFELPHNGINFWKNPLYFNYYGVDDYEYNLAFSDRFIYLKNPSLYSKLIYSNYILKDKSDSLNEHAFYINNYSGLFQKLDFNEDEISKVSLFKINTFEDLNIYNTNTQLFFEILEYLKNKNINIVICTVPMYKSYLYRRNTSILKRRNQFINTVKKEFPFIEMIAKEEDTINYSVQDYINHNHLNPDGAKKFTNELNIILNQLEKQ